MFGLPIKDILYASIILLLLGGFGWYTIHERDIGEAKEVAALKASSEKLQAAADAKVAQITAQHTTEVTTIKETYETALTADSAQRSSDAQRLRNYDAYRSAHGAVGSASPGPSTGGPVQSGTGSSDAIFSRLESVAGELADSARNANAALSACIADRAALTGK